MQRKGRTVGTLVHHPLDSDLALLLLAEGRRRQDFIDHP